MYLLDLKANFTSALLRDLMGMKSVYSMRLYDLLNQYRNIGKRTLEVEEIKRLFKIEKKYDEYKNLKARVITPSLREIEACTDLLVDMKEKKSGRSIVALEFTIRVKKGFFEKDKGGEVRPEDEVLFRRLLSHGLKEKKAKEYLNLYGENEPSRISGNIDKLEETIKAGKVKNTGAWLARAIDEDYRDQKSLFQVSKEEAGQQAKERKEDAQRRAREASALETEMERQEQAYLKHRQEFVETTVGALSVDERAKWEVEFGERLEGFFKRQWNIKPEWGSKITLPKAEGFILEKTGQGCSDQAEFTKGQGWTLLEELQKRREALL